VLRSSALALLLGLTLAAPARAQQFLYPFPSAHSLKIGQCDDQNFIVSTLFNRGFRKVRSTWNSFVSARDELWQNDREWIAITVRNETGCVTVDGRVN